MKKQIVEHYKSYQKKSDFLIIETYSKLAKKSEEKNVGHEDLEDIRDSLTAIKEVIQERNLTIPKKPEQNTAFDQVLKDGFKSLIIGLVVIVISLVMMSVFEGNSIPLIGIIIGGAKFIQGAIELGVGFYIRVTQADKFK